MQCQVKIICCLAFTLLSAVMGYAKEVQPVLGWETIGAQGVEVLPYTSAQGEVIMTPVPLFKEIGTYFWSWDPSKEPKKASDSIYLEPTTQINEIMTNLFVQFDVSDTAHFRKAWFQFTPDVRYRGLFGIHDFQKKRPLVVIRMGIHGNIDEMTAERFLARTVYHDLDANFLVLESSTSPAFLSKNKEASFGGVEEGLQTFLALHALRNSELSHIISSVHMIGLSLGAHGTFVAAMLDQQNGQHIKSIVNFCPLINLQKTFEFHSQPSFKNAMVDFWNAERLKPLVQRYKNEPAVRERWKTLFDFKPRFTPAMLSLLNRDRHRPLITVEEVNQIVPGMKWPKGFDTHLLKSESFFALNNFWPYFQGVKTPITIYTTPKDELVVNELNSELISTGEQPGDFSHVRHERLEKAIHCGLSSAYRWDYVVQLVREGLALK